MKLLRLIIGILSVVALTACDKEDSSINIFSLADDKQLGNQLEQEILVDPNTKLLSESTYANAYQYLNRVINTILATSPVNHRSDFDWKARLIQDDNILNAFAGPGGKIFVYTGIIKYLEAEDQFAGVMGHEIAHADRRHVTDEMTKAYGLQLLIQVTLGQNPGTLTQLAAGLATLRFSRGAEREADEYGVLYLDATKNTENWDSRGVGDFFAKLLADSASGANSTPEFLSTHPSPNKRVEAVNAKWVELGSRPGQDYKDRYIDFKTNMIP
ncbi:MAG: M48 family metalloprotease [Bacteroidota bacterium]|nr:M48 family metalloprotease [Bacteroidota bacterium]